jgi:hypothetical protein
MYWDALCVLKLKEERADKAREASPGVGNFTILCCQCAIQGPACTEPRKSYATIKKLHIALAAEIKNERILTLSDTRVTQLSIIRWFEDSTVCKTG